MATKRRRETHKVLVEAAAGIKAGGRNAASVVGDSLNELQFFNLFAA